MKPTIPDYVCFTAIRMSATKYATEVSAVLSKLPKQRTITNATSIRISDIYVGEPPRGGAHPKKVAIFSPQSAPSYAIMVTNLEDGWFSLSSIIARSFRNWQIFVTASLDSRDYPKYKITVWRNGDVSRDVLCMKDTAKWIFSERGEPEDFEDPSLYSNRRKALRLNRAIVARYMREIGLDFEQENFWESAGLATLISEYSN